MRNRRKLRSSDTPADEMLAQIAKARFYLHQGDADAVDVALSRLEVYARGLPTEFDAYASLANVLYGSRF